MKIYFHILNNLYLEIKSYTNYLFKNNIKWITVITFIIVKTIISQIKKIPLVINNYEYNNMLNMYWYF